MNHCSVKGCNSNSKTFRRGLCSTHYEEKRKNDSNFIKWTSKPRPIKERFEEKIELITECGCWIWMGSLGGGKRYGAISIGHKMVAAHRVSWELFNGSIPNNLHVLHRCDTPLCVNPHHLFLGTHQDNMNDRDSKKRLIHPLGSNNKSSKLTEEQVKKIKKDTRKDRLIAETYGVSRSTIHSIHSGKTWGHI